MVDIAFMLWLNWWMDIRQRPISQYVKNITGQKFGRLTVESYSGVDSAGYAVWKCRCDCGTIRDFNGPSLVKNHTRSCGCLKREEFLDRITKHGYVGTPEYNAWNNMLRRCIRPNHPQYHLYGGRGIKVCDEWMKFENFLSDVGRRPSELHSIHRIENDRGYEKGNVKWATATEQQNCRRNNHKISFGGKTQTITQWANEVGINYVAIHYRLKRGWSIEHALTTPLQRRTNG